MGRAALGQLQGLHPSRTPAGRPRHCRPPDAQDAGDDRSQVDGSQLSPLSPHPDRGQETGPRRPRQVRGRSGLHDRQTGRAPRQRLSGQTGRPDRSAARRRPPRPRRDRDRERNRVPDRGRRRGQHGVVHQLDLQLLRVGGGDSGHRHHAPEPGRRVRPHRRPSQPAGAEQTAAPHDHSGLRDPAGATLAVLRRDGRRHAAARARTSVAQLGGVRNGPPGGHRGPRFRHLAGLTVSVENLPEAVARELTAMGHQLRDPKGIAFGGSQAILKLARGWAAGSDPRKDGMAAGR